jgi:hypothetical protein
MHPDAEEIDAFAARRLLPEEATAIRRHLLSCPACRERLRASAFYPDQGRREAERIASLTGRPGCPEPAARVAAAAGALAAEQQAAVEEHARRCRACTADLRELRSLRVPSRARDADGRRGFRRWLWRR